MRRCVESIKKFTVDRAHIFGDKFIYDEIDYAEGNNMKIVIDAMLLQRLN